MAALVEENNNVVGIEEDVKEVKKDMKKDSSEVPIEGMEEVKNIKDLKQDVKNVEGVDNIVQNVDQVKEKEKTTKEAKQEIKTKGSNKGTEDSKGIKMKDFAVKLEAHGGEAKQAEELSKEGVVRAAVPATRAPDLPATSPERCIRDLFVTPPSFLEGEVTRLLAELRTLCTAANTDVSLVCGAWQMRCHSVVLRSRSPVLAELLAAGTPRVIALDDMEAAALGVVVNFMYFGEVGGLGGAVLAQVVAAAARLRVPRLLYALLPFLDTVALEDALGTLLVAEGLGLEPVVEVAVDRLTRERGELVGRQELRARLLARPRALLKLYRALCQEDEVGEVKVEGGAAIRACYGCGACSPGLYCPWCDHRPATQA